jgi:hypothetical protein
MEEQCFKKHGHSNSLSDPKTQAKARAALKEKTGYEYGLQNPENIKKRNKAWTEKYGGPNPWFGEDPQEKCRETKCEKYGSAYPNHFGQTEKEVIEFCNSFDHNFESTWKVLGNRKELDGYDDSLKYAVEYCGLYWHSDNARKEDAKTYHSSKFKICDKKDIRLFTIFEDEWKERNKQTRARLRSLLDGSLTNIRVDDCHCESLDLSYANQILDQWSVEGKDSKIVYASGMFCNDSLVGIMSFSMVKNKPTLSRCELNEGVRIDGWESTLFEFSKSYLSDQGYTTVDSYSDNRWSRGELQKKLGFEFVKELKPKCFYLNKHDVRYRYSRLKDVPSGEVFHIWDCGHRLWTLDISATAV